MEAREFKPKWDYKIVASWWEGYGQAPVPIHLLPWIGYIVDDVAAGFLYQTDSGIALLENFISNKDSRADARSDALDQITSALVKKAEELGYLHIIAFSSLPAIEERARKHGFSVGHKNYKIMAKEIPWDSSPMH